MKKYKLWFTTLCLALALVLVNLQPVRADTVDPNDPQGTSQKKSSTSSSGLSPEAIIMILVMLRLI